MAAHVVSDTYYVFHRTRTLGERYLWKGDLCDVVLQVVRRRENWTQQDQRNIHTQLLHNVADSRAGGSSEWLTANVMRGCSLPQDKIFSVLGLLPDALREAIRPNYHDPVEKIFRDVVKAHVNVTGWLNITCHSQYSPRSPAEYPSWMPNWMRTSRMTVFADRSRRGFNYYHPVDSTKASATFSGDLSVLTVEGFVVGIVERTMLEFTCLRGLVKMRGVYPDKGGREISAENVDTHGTRVRRVVRPGRGEPSDAAVWEFEEGFHQAIEPVLEGYDNIEMLDKLDLFLDAVRRRYVASKSKSPEQESKPISEGQQAKFYNSDIYTVVRGLLMSRTIFETKESQLGIAPDFTESGDLLCLLKGCDAPMILREHMKGSYTFIGDSHVSGLLRGEGIRELKDGRYTFTKVFDRLNLL
jgi:hypothetical protein